MILILGATALSAVVAAVVLLWSDGLVEFTGYQLVLLAIAAVALPRLRPPEASLERDGDDDSLLPRRPRLSRRLRKPAPRQLEKIERLVMFSRSTAFDAEWRLIPLLRAIAAERLESRRGIDVVSQPAAARALLGDEAWEVVKPGRTHPVDRMATGLTLEELDAAVTSIERI